jgi:hypothetical protein
MAALAAMLLLEAASSLVESVDDVDANASNPMNPLCPVIDAARVALAFIRFFDGFGITAQSMLENQEKVEKNAKVFVVFESFTCHRHAG